MSKKNAIKDRFRGFLPVVVDIETAGMNPEKHAILEVAMVIVDMDAQGRFYPLSTHFEHILPFDGALLDESSLKFTQIDPYQPLRFALEESVALPLLFQSITKAVAEKKCQRAVLVGHNAWFDLLFLKAAAARCQLTLPFHTFTCFDTATLGGLFYGQTVLSKAISAANIAFDPAQAHSALYDAEKTAELFCTMLNTWHG